MASIKLNVLNRPPFSRACRRDLDAVSPDSMSRFAWLAFALLIQAGDGNRRAGPDPSSVERRALAAVEGDSVERVQSRWARALERDSTDRLAALGLATLARLTYDDSAARRGYLALRGSDAVAAHAALGLGNLWRGEGRFVLAESSFSAVARQARALGDGPLVAEALMLLASMRGRLHGPGAALATLDTAALVIPTGDARLAAMHQCGRGETLTLTNQSGARAAADSGAKLARTANAGRIRAGCLHLVAALQARQGSMDSAIATYGEAVAERRRTRDRAGLASALQWRGSAYRSAGWLGRARQDLDEAAAAAEGTNPSAIPWIEANRAAVAVVAGDLETARRSAARASKLFADQGDLFGTVISLALEGDLARGVSIEGDLDSSSRAYETALQRAQAVGFGEFEFGLQIGLANVARVQNDTVAAARWLAAAEATGRRIGRGDAAAAVAYSRGVLALQRGDFASAERLLRAAEAGFPADQPNRRYEAAARIAEVLARRGHGAEAVRVLDSATAALDRWRADLDDRTLSLLAVQAREGDPDPDLGTATTIAALAARGRVDDAFAVAERGRARDLADHLKRAALFDTAATTASARVLAFATVARAAAVLPNDSTAWLEYVTGIGGEPTTVFVITRAGARAWILAPEDSLAPLIARFTVLLGSGAAPRELARTLGAALLDSAVASLPAAVRQLVVIPDGALNRVPFDALLLSDGRYALERYEIALAPSATVVTHLWANKPARASTAPADAVLIMADPKFAGETAPAIGDAETFRSAAAGAGHLPRLPGSSREARLVARYSSHATVRRRSAATEAWLEHAPLVSYRLIHLATHALVDEGSLSSTALALAPGDGADGFVTTAELAKLGLDADLVVLSACRTAGGALVRGEGIQGLATPLLAAGARGVVATWWPIGDSATVRFVADFYDALATGERAGTALRSAKLASLRRGAPAREWAAFTIIGDPLVQPSLRHPPASSPPALAAGVAILVVVLVGYGAWIRKRRAAERT